MSIGSMTYTPEVKTSFRTRHDNNGRVYMEVFTHDVMVTHAIYRIIANECGHITADLVSGIYYFYVGVACTSCPGGVTTWMQIGGRHENVALPSALSLTKGHALSLSGGTVADAGIDYNGAAGQFAIAAEDTDSSDTAHLMLIPDKIITIS